MAVREAVYKAEACPVGVITRPSTRTSRVSTLLAPDDVKTALLAVIA